jgi:DNA repair exonuclease SbcCD ATPase subunit
MPQESEKPGEPSRPSERDLLAERRARRAVDLDPTHPSAGAAAGAGHAGQANPGQNDPTDALTRRAEVAEATVQTLETHLSSLREQVREAAEERAVFAERLIAEQASVAEREHELRRVKQREYAEQQLRVEAEDRRARAERDSRAEIDRLTRRLGASEHRARELSQRLESAQRELDEAEQAAIAELGELRSVGERELRARFAELEHHALEIRHEISAERTARVEAEHRLAEMHVGYRRMELLVAELKGMMAQLRVAATREPSVAGGRAQRPVAPAEQREELADALAAAVERLRARAEAAASEPGELLDVSAGDPGGELAEAPAPGRSVEPDRSSAAPDEQRTPHKHSKSLLGRARLRRKQRHERRSAAAAPPNINAQ